MDSVCALCCVPPDRNMPSCKHKDSRIRVTFDVIEKDRRWQAGEGGKTLLMLNHSEWQVTLPHVP